MKTILIADDAAFMRLSLRKMLETSGYSIIGEAENGKIAVEKYKALKPDIITLDITMPEMDGIQALTSIKEYDENAKVIMISALGQESVVRKAIMLGAVGFVVKPFVQDTIVKAFEKL